MWQGGTVYSNLVRKQGSSHHSDVLWHGEVVHEAFVKKLDVTQRLGHTAAMTFRQWREQHGYSLVWAGVMCNLPPETLDAYERGVRIPTKRDAEVIEDSTDGAVPVSEWTTLPSELETQGGISLFDLFPAPESRKWPSHRERVLDWCYRQEAVPEQLVLEDARQGVLADKMGYITVFDFARALEMAGFEKVTPGQPKSGSVYSGTKVPRRVRREAQDPAVPGVVVPNRYAEFIVSKTPSLDEKVRKILKWWKDMPVSQRPEYLSLDQVASEVFGLVYKDPGYRRELITLGIAVNRICGFRKVQRRVAGKKVWFYQSDVSLRSEPWIKSDKTAYEYDAEQDAALKKAAGMHFRDMQKVSATPTASVTDSKAEYAKQVAGWINSMPKPPATLAIHEVLRFVLSEHVPKRYADIGAILRSLGYVKQTPGNCGFSTVFVPFSSIPGTPFDVATPQGWLAADTAARKACFLKWYLSIPTEHRPAQIGTSDVAKQILKITLEGHPDERTFRTTIGQTVCSIRGFRKAQVCEGSKRSWVYVADIYMRTRKTPSSDEENLI